MLFLSIFSLICFTSIAAVANKGLYRYLEKIEEEIAAKLFDANFTLNLTSVAETCTNNGAINVNISGASEGSLFDFQVKKNGSIVRTEENIPSAGGVTSITISNLSNCNCNNDNS